MIQEAHGNLLDAEADALVNTVNTVGVMGKGIALQFKRAFPENYKAYKRACDQGAVELGQMFIWDAGALAGDGPRYVINFPTKKHWRSKSKLSDIRAGLDDLVRQLKDLSINSVAVPPLGCGHGGFVGRTCARSSSVPSNRYPTCRSSSTRRRAHPQPPTNPFALTDPG